MTSSVSLAPSSGLTACVLKAVGHVRHVNIKTGDRPLQVVASRKRTLVSIFAGAGNIEGGNLAEGVAHETVRHVIHVNEGPLNNVNVNRIVALGESALVGSCARARNVKCGDLAVEGTQEAVVYIVGVKEHPRCRPAQLML